MSLSISPRCWVGIVHGTWFIFVKWSHPLHAEAIPSLVVYLYTDLLRSLTQDMFISYFFRHLNKIYVVCRAFKRCRLCFGYRLKYLGTIFPSTVVILGNSLIFPQPKQKLSFYHESSGFLFPKLYWVVFWYFHHSNDSCINTNF